MRTPHINVAFGTDRSVSCLEKCLLSKGELVERFHCIQYVLDIYILINIPIIPLRLREPEVVGRVQVGVG